MYLFRYLYMVKVYHIVEAIQDTFKTKGGGVAQLLEHPFYLAEGWRFKTRHGQTFLHTNNDLGTVFRIFD
jgi:hypothetical protein